MDSTPNLSLRFMMAAQAQKHVTYNEAMRALDALVQPMVLDKDLATPPGSPADGDRYIVAASPTGAWTGQAGMLAAFQDGAWQFYQPHEGWLAWVADEAALYTYSAGAWTELASGGLDHVADDTTPQLGGNLDANGHSIGFDDATGITDDAGNEQVLFHKTASAINQLGITNAAAGAAPQIAAEGGDTNISLKLRGKGTGFVDADKLGINATADTTNRLAVKSPASLLDNVGNGHQQKINKAAAGDTASQLFQTGYSGRAEFGLTGDDDFHVKVSPDGTAWYEAMIVDRSSGAARFPTTTYLDLPAGSAPATPASGKVRLYAKTDKSLYQKDDAGLETGLAGGGGAGTVTSVGIGAGLSSTRAAGGTTAITSSGTAYLDASFLLGYLSGLTISRASATTIGVAAGVCVDSTGTIIAKLGASTINCATTGALGLDTGSLANNTWYHVHVIMKTDGTVSALASTSATSPTYPSGYTLQRRIGSFKTNGSAQIIAFTQDGDYFRWAVAVQDADGTGAHANPGTSAVTVTLAVPTGVRVFAYLMIHITASATAARVLVSDIDAFTDAAPNAGSGAVGSHTGGNSSQDGRTTDCIRTNTSAQVRYRCDNSDANTAVYINTHGWRDTRGK